VTGTDWTRFEVEQISWTTFLKRNFIHAELLAAAIQRRRGGILEVGVGSGAQSAALSRLGSLVVSVDNDARILAAARSNLQRFGPGVRVLSADAFALPFPAAAFGTSVSQGLMEHFDDEAIGSLVREQLRVCRSVTFSVPSDRYPRQDVGDERLMDPKRWREIVTSAVENDRYRVTSRYYRIDSESIKYSVLAGRWLGRFSVLVTVDPRRG
jgi:SAM-dependent methyltransferase